MFTTINLDITTVTRGIVAHGCNCQGVMGSGVALHVRNKWPKAYDKYRELVGAHTGDKATLLGIAQIVSVDPFASIDRVNELFVANLFTQVKYGYDGKKYADLSAIKRGMVAVMSMAEGLKLPVYVPTIGCGRGGLSWDTDVEPLFRELTQMYPTVQLFVCHFPD